MTINEITPTTRADRLAEEIMASVLSGEFPAGLRLDEKMLADRYSVSRTPVREALRQLGSTGLIEIKPRRGATVASTTSGQLEMLFGAMAEAEATSARLCALSMTPLERRRLSDFHEAMIKFVRRNDPDGFAAANLTLHTQIYVGAHNTIIADFATSLRQRLAPFRRAQFQTKGRLARSHEEHTEVVSAILAGDPGAAHAAMFHHMSRVEQSFELLAKKI